MNNHDSEVIDEAVEAASAERDAEAIVPPSEENVFDEDSLTVWWRQAHRHDLLSASEEIALARRIEAGDAAALRCMVESNLRLVATVARQYYHYAGPALALADLVQEGSLGLVRAAGKFNYRRGHRFSTYAAFWIRQAVLRAIAKQGRIIRLPVRMVASVKRVDHAHTDLTQELGRPPTQLEIARQLKLTERKVVDIFDKMPEPLSLDVHVSGTDDPLLSDVIEDGSSSDPGNSLMHDVLRSEIARAFHNLPGKEATVLSLRYGLDGSGRRRTLVEVGRAMHLTRERIRQIEKRGLEHLQQSAPLWETVQYPSVAQGAFRG